MRQILLTAESDQAIIIVAYIVGILLMIIITRAIFSIGTIVRQLKAHTALLALIAENSGVNTEAIKQQVYAARDESYTPVKEKPANAEQEKLKAKYEKGELTLAEYQKDWKRLDK